MLVVLPSSQLAGFRSISRMLDLRDGPPRSPDPPVERQDGPASKAVDLGIGCHEKREEILVCQGWERVKMVFQEGGGAGNIGSYKFILETE